MSNYQIVFDLMLRAIQSAENWEMNKLNWNFVSADVHLWAHDEHMLVSGDVDAEFDRAAAALETARGQRFPTA